MAAPGPTLSRPDLGRVPLAELRRLIVDAEPLPPVPLGPLPVLDGWRITRGEHDLLFAEGLLESAAERLRRPLLTVAPRLSAGWLAGAGWIELGEHASLTSELDVVATLLGAELWCNALRRDLLALERD